MNQPDIILLATLNDRDMLAVNFWEDGQVGKPEPGAADELPSVIRHFTAHGYTYHRNLESSIVSSLLVRTGCDVATARKTVNNFLRQYYPRIH